MADQIIPLTSAPSQTLQVSLNVDGGIVQLQLAVRFSEMAGYWVITISDPAGNILLDSLPMLTGSYPAANVLAQHRYLKIGSAYVINASQAARDYPGISNLGNDFVILWSDTPAS